MLDYINTTDNHTKTCPLLVMGLGNPLMSDDGAGLELLKLVMEKAALTGDFSDQIIFEDGGTLGMSLLPSIEDAEVVVFLDAVRTGAEPGTVVLREKHELPGHYSRVISPHQIGLREVSGAAQLRGTLPDKMYLVGIEVETVEFVKAMSPAVLQAVPEAAERVLVLMRECLAEVEDVGEVADGKDGACTK